MLINGVRGYCLSVNSILIFLSPFGGIVKRTSVVALDEYLSGNEETVV
jgi:hypothetical protein